MFVVVGTTTLDLLVSGLERMPKMGEDEFTTSNLAFCREPLRMTPGGNGGNSAFALARLGADVTLCTGIGSDAAGRMLLDWLGEAGVDPGGIVRYGQAATSTTTIITDRARNRQSFHHAGASWAYGSGDLPEQLLRQAEVLLFTSYPLLRAFRPEGARRVLERAHRGGAVTALDLGPAVGRPAALEELSSVLPFVDYLLANAHELAVCTREADLESGIARVLDAGAACAVIKRGREGATLRPAGALTARYVPGFPVEAHGTVGAGDAFDAGFLFRLQQGADPEEAARFANAVAACVVSAPEGVFGSPTRAEVEAFLATSD